jgi:aromatic ring-cleaving dioxygenase
MSKQAKRFKPNKYGAKKVHLDGHIFDSHREARRYQALKIEERMGNVRNVQLQVEFPCRVGDRLICKYRADFTYDRLCGHEGWQYQVEDSKGHQTTEFKLKKKLVEALYPFTILLT